MKVASFLGKTLDDDVINLVVEKLSFENMKKDSQFVSEGEWRHLLEDSDALLCNVKVRRLCRQSIKLVNSLVFPECCVFWL